MNYQLLYNEINLPQYAGMADTEIAAALNAASHTRQRVPVKALAAKARELQVTLALRTASLNDATPVQVRAICQEVLSLVDGDIDSVDMDHPTSQAMFGALRQAGIISDQQAAAIDALANVPVASRAAALGLGVVTEADIVQARLWVEIDALRARLAAGYNAAVTMLETSVTVPAWDDLVAVIRGV
jgi:hypothetical protein